MSPFSLWPPGWGGKSRKKRPSLGKWLLGVEALETRDLPTTSVGGPLFLEPIPSQSIGRTQDTLTVDLQLTGGNGNAPTFAALLQSSEVLAFQLDSRFGFNVPASFQVNLRGLQEKNFKGSSNLSFFITPEGDLYRWGGSLARSTFLASFDPSFYDQPNKLCQAPFASEQVIPYQFQGNQLIFDPPPDYHGSLSVTVSVYDGANEASQGFQLVVGNQAPVIQPIPSQVVQNEKLRLTIPVTDEDGDPLTFSYSVAGPAGKVLGLRQEGEQIILDPALSDQGTYQVTVVVEDGLASTQAAFAVTVNKSSSIPLSFIPNRGQTDKQALFVAQTSGYNTFLTKQGMVLGLTVPGSTPEDPGTYVGQRIQFVGARAVNPLAGQALLGKANYYLAGNTSKKLQGITTSSEVIAKRIYPGIDVRYHGADSSLQYDFTVAPKADPNRITLAFPDAVNIDIDSEGRLVVDLPGEAGQLVQSAPVFYQKRGAELDMVAGRYVLKGANQAGFQVDSYDTKLPLVIDPYLFSSFAGGTITDDGNAIAVDAAGNLYVAGSSSSNDFPTTATPAQPALAGSSDIVILKLAPNGFGGYNPVYSTYMGGTGSDTASDIAVDSSGRAYVIGTTTGGAIGLGAFPITAGSFMDTSADGDFVTVVQLSSTGTLLFSAIPNSSSTDVGTAIAVDPLGSRIYIAGSTPQAGNDNYMISTPGAFQGSIDANRDAFFMVINPSAVGSLQKEYLSFLGGNFGDQVNAMALDGAGNFYLAGETNSPIFPIQGSGGQSIYGGGSQDAFVAKVRPLGFGPTDFLYSTYLGGIARDTANGIAVDTAGNNVYLTGETFGSFPVAGIPYQGVSQGTSDAFVARLTFTGPSTASFTAVTYLGGSSGEQGNDIALESLGNVYVVGETFSSDFPRVAEIQTFNSSTDAFVTVLDANLSTAQFSTYLGGNFADFGNAIALGPSGDIFVTGSTWSNTPTFPTVNPLGAPFIGGMNSGVGTDLFIAQLPAIAVLPPPPPPPPPPGTVTDQDRFEKNDTSLRPTKLGSLGIGGSIDQADLSISRKAKRLPDNDWFQFVAREAGTLTVTVDNVAAGSGDVHVRIYRLVKGVLRELKSSRAVGGSLTQTATVKVTAGMTLMVWAYGYDFSRGTYDLTVDLA